MEIRKGFENALSDIKKEFLFLEDFGFKFSNQLALPHRVNVSYEGKNSNILLNYEFLEENFDFCIVDKFSPDNYKQLWKLLKEFDPAFEYGSIKPSVYEYKPQLEVFAAKIKKFGSQIFK